MKIILEEDSAPPYNRICGTPLIHETKTLFDYFMSKLILNSSLIYRYRNYRYSFPDTEGLVKLNIILSDNSISIQALMKYFSFKGDSFYENILVQMGGEKQSLNYYLFVKLVLYCSFLLVSEVMSSKLLLKSRLL